MATKHPAGFITRPQAGKQYNRSQRQLERDVQEAYLTDNEETLSHFIVVTKDGEQILAKDTSPQQVTALVQEGNGPVWLVEETYLEQEYGFKGSPKPEKQTSGPTPESPPEKHRTGTQPTTVESKKEEGSHTSLPNDVDFLKERIRSLEREKREETNRNEEREAKLFAQLEVKDKQISAWDEVTQGITKGLATGQLTIAAPAEQNAQPTSPSVVVPATEGQDASDGPMRKTTATATTTKPTQTGGNNPTSRKSKPRPKPSKRKDRSKWNSFPTLKRIFSR